MKSVRALFPRWTLGVVALICVGLAVFLGVQFEKTRGLPEETALLVSAEPFVPGDPCNEATTWEYRWSSLEPPTGKSEDFTSYDGCDPALESGDVIDLVRTDEGGRTVVHVEPLESYGQIAVLVLLAGLAWLLVVAATSLGVKGWRAYQHRRKYGGQDEPDFFY